MEVQRRSRDRKLKQYHNMSAYITALCIDIFVYMYTLTDMRRTYQSLSSLSKLQARRSRDTVSTKESRDDDAPSSYFLTSSRAASLHFALTERK